MSLVAAILGTVCVYLGVRAMIFRDDDFRGPPLSGRAAMISGLVTALLGILLLLGGVGVLGPWGGGR